MDIITAVVFDFGGVLVEWDPRMLYRRYFTDPGKMERFLSEIDFIGWNSQQDRGRPFAEGVSELSARFPHYATLISAYHEHWVESVGDAIYGTIEILKRVKSQGYSVYGLSNWSAETFPLVSGKFDFFSLLDGYLLSGEVALAKPDEAIFLRFLSQFNRRAGECFFIDDSMTNVETARRLGFRAIHFTSPERLEVELTEQNILKR